MVSEIAVQINVGVRELTQTPCTDVREKNLNSGITSHNKNAYL